MRKKKSRMCVFMPQRNYDDMTLMCWNFKVRKRGEISSQDTGLCMTILCNKCSVCIHQQQQEIEICNMTLEENMALRMQ